MCRLSGFIESSEKLSERGKDSLKMSCFLFSQPLKLMPLNYFFSTMGKKLTMGRLKRLLKIDETKLDVYLQYYAGELELESFTPTQLEMLERYRKAWSLMSMGRPMQMVLSQLMREFQVEERQARYLIEESKIIHGELDRVDKDGRRAASIAYFDMISSQAFMDRNFEMAIKAREQADKLAKLHETDETGWSAEDFVKPAKFIFVNSVNVYKQSQIEIDE